MANDIIDPSQLNADDLEVLDPSQIDTSSFEVLHKPSKSDQIKAEMNKDTQGKALATSVGQGATMGLLDELMGLGGAIGYKAGSTPGIQSNNPETQAKLQEIERTRPDFKQEYEQSRDEARGEYKQLKEDNPWTTFGGELVGSALTGKALGDFVPGAKEVLSSPVKGGALMGGATAFGTSEAETPMGTLADTAIGAGEGAILGKLISKLGGGAKSADEAASDSPLVRQGKVAFNEGLKGNKFTGDAAKERIIGNQTGKVSDVVNQLDTAESTIGKLLRQSVESVDQPLSSINKDLSSTADDIIKILTEVDPYAIAGREKRDILKGLSVLKEGTLTPVELFDLKGKVYTALKNTDKYSTVGKDFYQASNQELNKIPNFVKYNEGFKKLREAGSEALLNKGVPGEFVNKTKGATNEADKNLFNIIKNISDKSALHGNDASAATATLQEFKKGLANLAENHPEILKESGLNPQKVLQDISELSDIQAVYKYVRQNKLESGGILQSIFHFTGRGKLLEGANVAGRGAKWMGDKIGSVDRSIAGGAGKLIASGVSNSIYKLDSPKMMQLAESIQQSKPLAAMGQALASAVTENNVAKKNAIIFSLLQNPEARNNINEFMGNTADAYGVIKDNLTRKPPAQ